MIHRWEIIKKQIMKTKVKLKRPDHTRNSTKNHNNLKREMLENHNTHIIVLILVDNRLD